MKKQKLVKILALSAIFTASVANMAACGGNDHGGRTEIDFWYSAGSANSKIIRSMVKAYNDGQGVEDGVYVTPDNRQNIDKSSLMIDAPAVVAISDESFKSYAVEGLFHDMTVYYNSDSGEYSESKIPASLVNRFRIDKTESNGKLNAGEGAAIQGVPFGATCMVYYYSKSAFENQKINVISATAEELAANEAYASVMPHGYAEYKNKPYSEAVSSTNMAGETVYKVFNNKIAMNWDEYRYLSKMFTKSYNATSPTTFGITQHWWFSYGWSVGGDCIGYNTETNKYEFTVADKTPNYLVTAADGLTIGTSEYAAGEIVRYEDKNKITSQTGLYELPSQYDALAEFVRTTAGTTKTVDGDMKGYGISTADKDNSASTLIDGTSSKPRRLEQNKL